MTATIFLLSVFSPLAIAALRSYQWSGRTTAIIAALIIIGLTALGYILDGRMTWPVPGDFWLDLMAFFGSQQAAYLGLNQTPIISKLEQVGNYADVH